MDCTGSSMLLNFYTKVISLLIKRHILTVDTIWVMMQIIYDQHAKLIKRALLLSPCVRHVHMLLFLQHKYKYIL